MTSIHQNIYSPCHLVTKSSIHSVVYLPCHLFTMSNIDHHDSCHPFMSSSHVVILLPSQPVTMAFIHHVINSLCHPATISSTHPDLNSHLPCHPFTMSSNQDHGPCHPFSMPSIHRFSQSPHHSDSISSCHPQVTRPEELNQKVFLVLLETTLARGASTLGQILLSLFCMSYIFLLLAPYDPPPFHC